MASHVDARDRVPSKLLGSEFYRQSTGGADISNIVAQYPGKGGKNTPDAEFQFENTASEERKETKDTQ